MLSFVLSVMYTNINLKLCKNYMYQCITKQVLHVYTMDTVLYSAVITRQSNPPISKFSRPCNEIMSVWSMFLCNTNSNEQCYVNEGVPFRMQSVSREGTVGLSSLIACRTETKKQTLLQSVLSFFATKQHILRVQQY